MEGNMLYYVLVFPTILNTILLIVMAFVLYKLLAVAGDLSFKAARFMERGEEEIFATNRSVREAADQAAGLLEKITQVIDKYAFAKSFNNGEAGSPKVAKILSGITIGFNVFKFLSSIFKKNKSKE